MIEVTYEQGHGIRMKGHANAAPKGEDMVCACASHNLYMFDYMVESFVSSGIAKDEKIEITEGKAEIFCEALPGYRHVVAVAMDAVADGFRILEARFPEFVKFIEKK